MNLQRWACNAAKGSSKRRKEGKFRDVYREKQGNDPEVTFPPISCSADCPLQKRKTFLAPYAITQCLLGGNEVYPPWRTVHACLFFPGTAILSLMTDLDHDGANAEKVSIGREGFLGWLLFLVGERLTLQPLGSFVKFAGSATSHFPYQFSTTAFERFACLRCTTRRYAQTLVIQLM